MRVTFLSVDEVWEFGGVAQEEDGGVVEHPIQIAFLRLQLDGET